MLSAALQPILLSHYNECRYAVAGMSANVNVNENENLKAGNLLNLKLA